MSSKFGGIDTLPNLQLLKGSLTLQCSLAGHVPVNASEKKLKVEAETNQPETELRLKIKALELETTKLPSISSKQPDELEIAKELDRMSAKLESIDELLSSSSPADLEVQSLLSGTADLWMPVITATTEERQAFAASSVAAEEQDTLNNGING